MKSIRVIAVAAGRSMGSGLSTSFTRAKTMFAQLSKSEVAEAMIATWCMEFLRVRKVGGFNVVEVIVVSALMLGVKTIIQEAGRRRGHEGSKSFVMSNRYTQMGRMAPYRDPFSADRRVRRARRDRQSGSNYQYPLL